MASNPLPPDSILTHLREGLVIPAHPLALTNERKFDERHQRALTRYYHAAGAGGIAVGVHTTQFEIRDPKYGLYQPVLELASETIQVCDQKSGKETVRIAGLVGKTAQALSEARLASETGYHAGLLSLAAMKETGDEQLIEHCRVIAEIIPLVGFYLQPAVGGRVLSLDFWRSFAEIPNVVAIKVAPFNRYQTLDVVRAVAESGRAGEIALYTGNDDNIVLDLVSEYSFPAGEQQVKVHFAGGLLGHWACWTKKAVELLEQCKTIRQGDVVTSDVLTLALQVTESNAALFDPPNQFAGAIAGVHEVLRRQGLMENNYCLNPSEVLSPGQIEEIDRVYRIFPHLNDDDFVLANLQEWLY